MSFAEDVRAWAEETKRRQRDVFVGCVGAVHGSVTEGSQVTGAPGQPVDTSNLLRSWLERFPEELIGEVVTNVSYARAVEDGERKAHVRAAHTRGPYTRSDGTQVRAHDVRAHEVAGGPINFRSPVGGAHSVKLTRAGWPLLVEDVVRRVAP